MENNFHGNFTQQDGLPEIAIERATRVLRSGRLKNEDAWKKWRGKMDKYVAIVAQLARAYDAIHVKTQEVFDAAAKAVSPEHWIWDGVHPLPQGHELIARNWLQQVSGRFVR